MKCSHVECVRCTVGMRYDTEFDVKLIISDEWTVVLNEMNAKWSIFSNFSRTQRRGVIRKLIIAFYFRCSMIVVMMPIELLHNRCCQ